MALFLKILVVVVAAALTYFAIWFRLRHYDIASICIAIVFLVLVFGSVWIYGNPKVLWLDAIGLVVGILIHLAQMWREEYGSTGHGESDPPITTMASKRYPVGRR